MAESKSGKHTIAGSLMAPEMSILVSGTRESSLHYCSFTQLTVVPPDTCFLHRHIFWSFFTLLLAKTVIFFPHLKKKLFIWLHWVLVAAHGICGCDMQTFSCSTWGLVPWLNSGPPHWGHGVLTLDHQGSPFRSLLIITLTVLFPSDLCC